MNNKNKIVYNMLESDLKIEKEENLEQIKGGRGLRRDSGFPRVA